jgi:hypothetical protein
MSNTSIVFRQFERSACHCAFYAMIFVQLQTEGVKVENLLIAALVSYLLALGLAPPLNRMMPKSSRTRWASFGLLAAVFCISLPTLLQLVGLEIPRQAVQGWAIFPLAIYHYCSVVQLVGVIESTFMALLPYFVGGILGILIGVFFTNINIMIPMIIMFSLNFTNPRKPIDPNDPWG